MDYKISLNGDKNIVHTIREALNSNDGYCPCRVDNTNETKCMCKEFREQTFTGYCHCGLYYKTPNYKYVCVDFDGTIVSHKFPNIGEANVTLIEKLRLMHDSGTKIILHTCREDGEVDLNGVEHNYLSEAVNWCRENNVPFDSVNSNPWVSFGERKVYADIYIDDRAFNVNDVDLL